MFGPKDPFPPRSLCQSCTDSGKKVYRGHEKTIRTGYIIGHEFTGTIMAVGSGVKHFKPGDKVVSPFTRYPPRLRLEKLKR